MAFKLTNVVSADSIAPSHRGRAPIPVYAEIAESLRDLYVTNPTQVVKIERSDPQLVEAFENREKGVPEAPSLFFALNRAVERLANDEFPNLRLQRWDMHNKSVVTVRCTNKVKRKLPPHPSRKKKTPAEAPVSESQDTATSETENSNGSEAPASGRKTELVSA